jgi:hypothetical protein
MTTLLPFMLLAAAHWLDGSIIDGSTCIALAGERWQLRWQSGLLDL